MYRKRSKTNNIYFEDIEPLPYKERYIKFHKDKIERRGRKSNDTTRR